jgi:hypothetical protein
MFLAVICGSFFPWPRTSGWVVVPRWSLLKMAFPLTVSSLLSLSSGGRGGTLPLFSGLLYGRVCHIPPCLLLFGFRLLQAARRGLPTCRKSSRRLRQSWRHYTLPECLRGRSPRLMWNLCGILCIIVTRQ